MTTHHQKFVFKDTPLAESIFGDSKKTGTELIKTALKTIPEKPGIYQFYNAEQTLIYIGKARSLNARLAQYARLMGQSNRHIQMITSIHQIDYIITKTEIEALLLEANLIKHLKPYYNILLRDDKSFPYLLIKQDHPAPQLVKHRGAKKYKGAYFGPFASAHAVNHTLELLQKTFQLRSCRDHVYANRTRPCLLYQIKRCSAPCVGKISLDEYQASIHQAKAFLTGQSQTLRQTLQHKMKEASSRQKYEEALVLRNRLQDLARISAQQNIHVKTFQDADIFAVFQREEISVIHAVFYRSGQHYGGISYFPKQGLKAEASEVLNAFLSQFYDNKPAPSLILLNKEIQDRPLLIKALREKNQKKITISIPKRGEKHNVLCHAITNAKEALHQKLLKKANIKKQLALLKQEFQLKTTPKRIEIYDNSHIQGKHAIGAFVVFGENGFDKKQYRKFNIKSNHLKSGDDYAMMHEVFKRRFSRLTSSDTETWPDLILIDGGKGHLNTVLKTLKTFDLNRDDLTLIAIAKGKDRNAGKETYFRKDHPPYHLDHHPTLAYFMQRLRDEAHRFAIGSHRAKRKKQIRENPLDEIKNIGQKRKKNLLQYFGSAKQISEASLSDLEKIEGIHKSLAQKIYDYFHE